MRRRIRHALSAYAAALGAVLLVAACGGDPPPPSAAFNNDPVPMARALQTKLLNAMSMNGQRLELAHAVPPAVSAERAREIAGADFLGQLKGNDLPPQDTSNPDALIRVRFIDPGREPTNVWVVVYHWRAGVCDAGGGPAPCPISTLYYMIDDRSGQITHVLDLG